jgi:4-hydroxybenzoate polyprenyltransferase
MKTLRWLGAVLFNNRIHVSLMPGMLTCFWGEALALPLPLAYYAMITVQTAGAYWWNMITDKEEDSINYPREGRFIWPDSKGTRLLILACFVTSFTLGLRAGWGFIAFGSVMNILGTLYGLKVKLPRSSRTFRIKSIPWLKNAYSSLFWSASLVLSPYVYLHLPIDRRAWWAVAISFCLAFFVELMWDVRDVVGDRFAGVRTLPIVLGEARTRWLLHGLNASCATLSALGLVFGSLPPPYWMIMLHSVGGFMFVEWYFRLKERQLASHAYLLLGGAMIVATVALGNPGRTILPGIMQGHP